MDDALTIFIISDSTGETAQTYLKSVTTQFPDLKTSVKRRSEIKTKEEIDEVFEEITEYSIIVPTMADKDLANYICEKAADKNIEVLAILEEGIKAVEKVTGQKLSLIHI